MQECNISEGSPDLETWTLPAEGACLLGAKRTLRRRRRDAGCFFPPDWAPAAAVEEPCPCAAADVECEFGFQRGANATCGPIPQLSRADACPVRRPPRCRAFCIQICCS